MSAQASEVVVPPFPTISAEEFTRMAAQEPSLCDGDFRLIVPASGFRIFVGKNVEKGNVGQVYYSVTFLPLSNPRDANSAVRFLRVEHILTSPFKSAGQTNEPPGRSREDLVRFMHAVFPDECPDYPRRGEGLAKGTYNYNGRVVGAAEVGDAKSEALQLAAAKLRAAHENPSITAGWAVDARRGTSAKGGRYFNFYAETELPADWGYSTPRPE